MAWEQLLMKELFCTPTMFAFSALLTLSVHAYGQSLKGPIAWVDPGIPHAAGINSAFTRVMSADGDLGQAVVDLEAETHAAHDPWEAAQLLATAYDVVGRYADARKIRNAHRKRTPQCVYSGEPWPYALARVPKVVNVLMINEDHLDPTTRANVLVALPFLRNAGYTRLALEALPDANMADEVASGNVPDTREAGTYLRDPIAALMVREAIRLGFHLEAYDADEDFDTREKRQASRLLALSKRDTGKLLVVTGPGHVALDGNWMAQYLAQDLGKRLYTIDQVSNAGADCDKAAMPNLTVRDRKKAGHLLGLNTDAALVSPAPRMSPTERSYTGSWLSIGGLRAPMAVSTGQVCPGKPTRCLIEANRKGGQSHSVPDDRYLTRGIWRGYLFVPPGEYLITGIDEKGTRRAVISTAKL
jgi:hypothetical protein